MKKIIASLSFLLLISCIKEEDSYTYHRYIRIKNASDKVFKIVIEDVESLHKYLEIDLKPNESTEYYQQSSLSNNFDGFSFFKGSSLKIIFDINGKGYICGDYPDNTGLCFTTKGSPFGNTNENEFVLEEKVSDNVKYYTYEITQQDYENAHILP